MANLMVKKDVLNEYKKLYYNNSNSINKNKQKTADLLKTLYQVNIDDFDNGEYTYLIGTDKENTQIQIKSDGYVYTPFRKICISDNDSIFSYIFYEGFVIFVQPFTINAYNKIITTANLILYRLVYDENFEKFQTYEYTFYVNDNTVDNIEFLKSKNEISNEYLFKHTCANQVGYLWPNFDFIVDNNLHYHTLVDFDDGTALTKKR